jgi:hypothetical protein
MRTAPQKQRSNQRSSMRIGLIDFCIVKNRQLPPDLRLIVLFFVNNNRYLLQFLIALCIGIYIQIINSFLRKINVQVEIAFPSIGHEDHFLSKIPAVCIANAIHKNYFISIVI